MYNPRDFLLLFYALFWAQLLATSSRYNAFPTAAILNPSETDGRSKRLGRLVASVFLLNLFPIVWLWFLWSVIVVDHSASFAGLAGAALAALSIFGVIRLYHAIVASSGCVNTFYTPDEQSKYEIQGSYKLERPHYSHWVPGLIYMTVFPLAAYFVGRL